MSNGYASDNSNGSNKRVRHADTDTVAILPKNAAANAATSKKNTPFELGVATANRFIATLHPDLQPLLKGHAEKVLLAHATHFRNRKTYEKEKNDDTIIPSPCKHVISLKPRAVVAKDPGFNDLVRETDAIVLRCQLMMKEQWMKCQEMNVQSYKDDIARAFAKALPQLAGLLLAQEGLEPREHHTVVANLLTHNRDDVLAFLNVTDDWFAAEYCKIHSLDRFPTPTTPNIPQQPAVPHVTTPTGPIDLRGGAGGTETLDGRGRGRRTPSTTTARDNILAATTRLRPEIQGQQPTAESPQRGNNLENQFQTAETLLQGLTEIANAPGFDYDGPEEQDEVPASDTTPVATNVTTQVATNVTTQVATNVTPGQQVQQVQQDNAAAPQPNPYNNNGGAQTQHHSQWWI